MAAKYISAGMNEGNMIHVRKCQIGSGTDAPADVVLGALGTDVVSSDNNSTGLYPIFYVQAGIVVTDMVVDKIVAFNSTGAFVMHIGDTDVDGFWPNSDLVASDAGIKSLKTHVSTAEGQAYPAYVSQRVYVSGGSQTAGSTGDTFNSDGWCPINVQVTTAKLNAGKADVYLYYYDKNAC